MNSNVDAAIFSTNDIDIADQLAEINMARDDEYFYNHYPFGDHYYCTNKTQVYMIYPLLNDEPETPGSFTLSA